jgi:hypothetical protein
MCRLEALGLEVLLLTVQITSPHPIQTHLALTRPLTSIPGFCDLRNPRRTTLGRKVGWGKSVRRCIAFCSWVIVYFSGTVGKDCSARDLLIRASRTNADLGAS